MPHGAKCGAVLSPVAGIDCGTNSVRLLVAEVGDDGALHERARLMRIVRLGEKVDRTGEFSADALERTFAALDEYADVIRSEGVTKTRFVATSASRDVRNRGVFVEGIRSRLGVEPEVISGVEEAALSFAGAIRGLPPGLAPAPTLVVDIGGGSTEFVLGADAPTHSISVNIGCVRITERHLHADPPTDAQVAAAEADVAREIGNVASAVPLADAACIVGVAGSVTTVAAMAMGLDRYDADLIHGSVIAATDVNAVAARLLAMSRRDRAALGFMHPGRVDVIGAGAMILRAAVRIGGFESVIVSETDILDGIVYSIGA